MFETDTVIGYFYAVDVNNESISVYKNVISFTSIQGGETH